MSKFLESRHLRLIMEVARTESVTRAADRLNVTQSAVSHQLREIEGQARHAGFHSFRSADVADRSRAG